MHGAGGSGATTWRRPNRRRAADVRSGRRCPHRPDRRMAMQLGL